MLFCVERKEKVKDRCLVAALRRIFVGAVHTLRWEPPSLWSKDCSGIKKGKKLLVRFVRPSFSRRRQSTPFGIVACCTRSTSDFLILINGNSFEYVSLTHEANVLPCSSQAGAPVKVVWTSL